MSLDDWKLGELLAYQGKKGCQDARCTHFFTKDGMSEDCYGWHCAHCDQPCSSQGHRNCPARETTSDADQS